jgi:hypothetical protein
MKLQDVLSSLILKHMIEQKVLLYLKQLSTWRKHSTLRVNRYIYKINSVNQGDKKLELWKNSAMSVSNKENFSTKSIIWWSIDKIVMWLDSIGSNLKLLSSGSCRNS